MQDKDAPIWVSLSKGRTELYRDIQLICYGNCDFIQRYEPVQPKDLADTCPKVHGLFQAFDIVVT